MTRALIASFALVLLAVVPGCERKPTNPPEAPAEEEADFAPPEEYEIAGAAAEEQGEEEVAPGLSSR